MYFKAGDRVRVRDDIKMLDGIGHISELDLYAGVEGTVVKRHMPASYPAYYVKFDRIVFDIITDSGWYFDERFLEPALVTNENLTPMSEEDFNDILFGATSDTNCGK